MPVVDAELMQCRRYYVFSWELVAQSMMLLYGVAHVGPARSENLELRHCTVCTLRVPHVVGTYGTWIGSTSGCSLQGCWRALLWNNLQSAGYTNIDFVGTLPPQGCGVSYDGDNEGHGGYLGTNIADQNQLPGWLSKTKPDVVIMHLGTNDVWNNRSPTVITTAFSKLVDQMRASNADMKILVGVDFLYLDYG